MKRIISFVLFSVLFIGLFNGIAVGALTEDDAIYLLYHLQFGNEEYPLSQSVDFNGDGKMNSDDAVYLLYHVMFGKKEYPI